MKLFEEFKLVENMWDNLVSLTESTTIYTDDGRIAARFYSANESVQDYVDDVGPHEGGYTLIRSFWLPTNRGKLNVGLVSLDETGGENGMVCIPSYDVQFIVPMDEAEDVYDMLYESEPFDDIDAFIAKFVCCSYARSVKRVLDSGVGHLIEGITNKVLTWTCFFDDKEIGTVEAATEDEALEKMMDKYPEYPYSKYDGCYYVNSGLNESISNKEIVAVLKDARETSKDFGITDEFTFEYYIGNAVSAAGYPMDSLFMFFPDHVSENDKEYRDAVRGWLENEGLDKNAKTSI